MLTPKQASALNPSPPTPANFSPSRPHLRDHYQPATRTQTADVTLDDSAPPRRVLATPPAKHTPFLLSYLRAVALLHRNHLPNLPTLVQTQPKPRCKTGDQNMPLQGFPNDSRRKLKPPLFSHSPAASSPAPSRRLLTICLACPARALLLSLSSPREAVPNHIPQRSLPSPSHPSILIPALHSDHLVFNCLCEFFFFCFKRSIPPSTWSPDSTPRACKSSGTKWVLHRYLWKSNQARLQAYSRRQRDDSSAGNLIKTNTDR